MSAVLVPVAVVVIVGAAVDMVWTTVALGGTAGPMSHRVMVLTWRTVRRLSHRHVWLQASGIVGVVGNVVLWVALAVAGWALLFSASPQAVITADTGTPAGGLDRLYFAGFTVSTLGVGDFVPGSPLWQVLTVVASFNGLAAATLGITYLVAVTSAVVDRRTLALTVTSLGCHPDEIVLRAARDPRGWEPFERQIEDIARRLMRLSQQHLAYPALHLFHDGSINAAAPVAVAKLTEAVLVIEHGLEGPKPSRISMAAVRASRHELMALLLSSFLQAPDDDPPAPGLAALRNAGLATVDDAQFATAVDQHSAERRRLLGYLRNDGWSWDDVTVGAASGRSASA